MPTNPWNYPRKHVPDFWAAVRSYVTIRGDAGLLEVRPGVMTRSQVTSTEWYVLGLRTDEDQ